MTREIMEVRVGGAKSYIKENCKWGKTLPEAVEHTNRKKIEIEEEWGCVFFFIEIIVYYYYCYYY